MTMMKKALMVTAVAATLLFSETVSAFSSNRNGVISRSRQAVATQHPRVMTTTSLNLLNKEQVPVPEKSSSSPSSSSSLDALLEDTSFPVTLGMIAAGYTIYKYSEYLQDLVDKKLEDAKKESPAPAPAPAAPALEPEPTPPAPEPVVEVAEPAPAPAPAPPKPAPVPIAVPVGAPATPIKTSPPEEEPVAEEEEETAVVEEECEDEEEESPKKKTIRFVKFLYFPWLGMIPEIKRMLSKKD